jgi:hypothetical protein
LSAIVAKGNIAQFHIAPGASNSLGVRFFEDIRGLVKESEGSPFVTLPVLDGGERGLLGVALHPGFASNGYVYLYYTTDQGGAHNRISRFVANGDVALAGSEEVLVDLPPVSGASKHNGGALAFGVDGKLYVAVGDDADGSNAPSLATPFGKMLRFNADGTFVEEAFINARTASGDLPARPGDIAFSPDPEQSFLYVVDMANSKILTLRRGTLETVDTFGQRGRNAGAILSPHSLALDSRGNLYLTETTDGSRLQKFVVRFPPHEG